MQIRTAAILAVTIAFAAGFPAIKAQPTAGANPGAAVPASLFDSLANTVWTMDSDSTNGPSIGWFKLNSDMTIQCGWSDKEAHWWKVLSGSMIEARVTNKNLNRTLTFNRDFTQATDQFHRFYYRLKPPVSGSAKTNGSPAATPVPPAAAQTSPAPADAGNGGSFTGDFLRNASDSLLFVEGKEGKGSGFVASIHGKKVAITNIHVLAGNENPRVTLLDNKPLAFAGASAAVGHDILAIAISSGGTAMDCSESVDKDVKVGDAVVVLGNEEGADVVRPIEGKIVGIGPDLVEVDAQFQPGNSGSPIVHKASGKVIGVATYVTIRQFTKFTDEGKKKKKKKKKKEEKEPDEEVRRFGYRIDSIQAWQPINWSAFAADAAAIKKIDALTNDLSDVIHDIEQHKGHINAGAYQTPAVSQAVGELAQAQHTKRMSREDIMEAVRSFFLSLRALSQADGVAASRLTYDYFRREFTDEQRTRDEIYKAFDDALKTVQE